MAGELLERFSLTDAGDRVVKTYSGGMRRRLDLAVSLLATPPVLFLDEPTTGLDPRSRLELWEVLRDLVNDGTTLVLTTQYLEEADQLADRIIVIDHGRVIEDGTALELKDRSGAAALVVTVSRSDQLQTAADLMRAHFSEVHVEEGPRQVTAAANGLQDVTRVAETFAGSGIELDDLGLKRPSLDDVFLHLTGHRADRRRRQRRTRGEHAMTTTQTGTTTAAARPQLRRTTLWQQSLAVVRRNGAHYRQQPEMLLDVTIQPIMFVLLFAFVFGASIQVLSPGGYREWLLGGIMGQTVTFAAFIVAIGLTADIEKGIVDRLRSLPIHRSALLVGRSISSLLHSSVGIVIMSLTGLLIGWRIRDGIPRAVLAYGLLLLWGFAMIWFGIWIGSLMKTRSRRSTA